MRQKRPRQGDTSSLGQVRIIGGKYRGRKLPVRNQIDLRPSGDRVRETLFNWLQNHIVGARCADLFSGSGALGFEALSRGAADVFLIDINADNTHLLNTNKALLNAASAHIVTGSGLDWLAQHRQPLDIIFIDPPFSSSLLGQTLALLSEHPSVHADSQIYIEARRDTALLLPTHWQWRRHQYSGDIQFGVAELKASKR